MDFSTIGAFISKLRKESVILVISGIDWTSPEYNQSQTQAA